MHDLLSRSNFAAKKVADSLVSKANTQYRNVRFQNRLPTNTKILVAFWAPGTGRNHYIVRPKPNSLPPINFVISNYNRLFTVNLEKILIEIKSERIIIVDEECLHFYWGLSHDHQREYSSGSTSMGVG